jgi:hypothetical protein
VYRFTLPSVYLLTWIQACRWSLLGAGVVYGFLNRGEISSSFLVVCVCACVWCRLLQIVYARIHGSTNGGVTDSMSVLLARVLSDGCGALLCGPFILQFMCRFPITFFSSSFLLPPFFFLLPPRLEEAPGCGCPLRGGTCGDYLFGELGGGGGIRA